MADIKIPSFGPKCPNHNVTLVDLPFPLPREGTGICPISSCPLDFTIELDEEKVSKDKFGNETKDVHWNVSGDEK